MAHAPASFAPPEPPRLVDTDTSSPSTSSSLPLMHSIGGGEGRYIVPMPRQHLLDERAATATATATAAATPTTVGVETGSSTYASISSRSARGPHHQTVNNDNNNRNRHAYGHRSTGPRGKRAATIRPGHGVAVSQSPGHYVHPDTPQHHRTKSAPVSMVVSRLHAPSTSSGRYRRMLLELPPPPGAYGVPPSNHHFPPHHNDLSVEMQSQLDHRLATQYQTALQIADSKFGGANGAGPTLEVTSIQFDHNRSAIHQTPANPYIRSPGTSPPRRQQGPLGSCMIAEFHATRPPPPKRRNHATSPVQGVDEDSGVDSGREKALMQRSKWRSRPVYDSTYDSSETNSDHGSAVASANGRNPAGYTSRSPLRMDTDLDSVRYETRLKDANRKAALKGWQLELYLELLASSVVSRATDAAVADVAAWSAATAAEEDARRELAARKGALQEEARLLEAAAIAQRKLKEQDDHRRTEQLAEELKRRRRSSLFHHALDPITIKISSRIAGRGWRTRAAESEQVRKQKAREARILAKMAEIDAELEALELDRVKRELATDHDGSKALAYRNTGKRISHLFPNDAKPKTAVDKLKELEDARLAREKLAAELTKRLRNLRAACALKEVVLEKHREANPDDARGISSSAVEMPTTTYSRHIAKQQQQQDERQRSAHGRQLKGRELGARNPTMPPPHARSGRLSELLEVHRTFEPVTGFSLQGMQVYPLGSGMSMTLAEEEYLAIARHRIDAMAEHERIAHSLGFKRPHILLISSKWQISDEHEMSFVSMAKFKGAVRSHDEDGNPVIVVGYNWGITPDQLLAKIHDALQKEAEHCGVPGTSVHALSIGMMVHHSHGSLFMTKEQLTSITTLSLEHDDESLQVQRFWEQLDVMLSGAGPRTFAAPHGKNIGDRSELEINMLGHGLFHTEQGQGLAVMLGTMIQCTVQEAILPYGHKLVEKYFHWDKFTAAHEAYKMEKRVNRIGYDPHEDVSISAKFKRTSHVGGSRSTTRRTSSRGSTNSLGSDGGGGRLSSILAGGAVASNAVPAFTNVSPAARSSFADAWQQQQQHLFIGGQASSVSLSARSSSSKFNYVNQRRDTFEVTLPKISSGKHEKHTRVPSPDARSYRLSHP